MEQMTEQELGTLRVRIPDGIDQPRLELSVERDGFTHVVAEVYDPRLFSRQKQAAEYLLFLVGRLERVLRVSAT